MSDSAVPARASSAPVPAEAPFDVEADVVVVGGGGGGLPAALFARWLGDEVVLLEKAPELGGTAKKAAFWYWIPNNAQMQDLGIPDAEEDFLRYVARLSRPQHYDPDSPTFGMNEWEFALCRAIYESASPAAELLRERDALPYRHCRDVPDYWSELPEDKAPTGRVLVPEGARESMSDGGEVGIRTMSAAAERDGVDVRTGHRVQRLVTRRRRGRGRRGDDRRRSHAARAGAQGRDLRHRRLHARPRAARELPLPAGLRRLCGDHERGRLRPHRVVGRRAAAQHEPRVDVPGPAREGDRAPPGHGRHVLGRGRLDDLRRQARPARRQREAPLQRALPGVLPLGPAHRRVPEPRPDPGLGPAQPGPLRQRRVRPADRARRHRRRPRHPRRDARGPVGGDRRPARALPRAHRRPDARRRLHREPPRRDRALQRLRRARRRRGLPPRRARRPAAVQRARPGGATGARTRRCGRSRATGRTTPRS